MPCSGARIAALVAGLGVLGVVVFAEPNFCPSTCFSFTCDSIIISSGGFHSCSSLATVHGCNCTGCAQCGGQTTASYTPRPTPSSSGSPEPSASPSTAGAPGTPSPSPSLGSSRAPTASASPSLPPPIASIVLGPYASGDVVYDSLLRFYVYLSSAYDISPSLQLTNCRELAPADVVLVEPRVYTVDCEVLSSGATTIAVLGSTFVVFSDLRPQVSVGVQGVSSAGSLVRVSSNPIVFLFSVRADVASFGQAYFQASSHCDTAHIALVSQTELTSVYSLSCAAAHERVTSVLLMQPPNSRLTVLSDLVAPVASILVLDPQTGRYTSDDVFGTTPDIRLLVMFNEAIQGSVAAGIVSQALDMTRNPVAESDVQITALQGNSTHYFLQARQTRPINKPVFYSFSLRAGSVADVAGNGVGLAGSPTFLFQCADGEFFRDGECQACAECSWFQETGAECTLEEDTSCVSDPGVVVLIFLALFVVAVLVSLLPLRLRSRALPISSSMLLPRAGVGVSVFVCVVALALFTPASTVIVFGVLLGSLVLNLALCFVLLSGRLPRSPLLAVLASASICGPRIILCLDRQKLHTSRFLIYAGLALWGLSDAVTVVLELSVLEDEVSAIAVTSLLASCTSLLQLFSDVNTVRQAKPYKRQTPSGSGIGRSRV